MDELIEYFDKVISRMADLKSDIASISVSLEKQIDEEKKGKSDKDVNTKDKPGIIGQNVSMKSIRPSTVLRKDSDEAKYAEENKEETYIVDRLNEIFGD